MTQDRIITSEIPQPRDAWDTLSMKEKAEMIGVAVRNGITSLKDIRQKYNEFAEGGNIYDGESQPSNQMITTGGTGHIPDNYGQSTIDAVRRRLYRNITPFGYHNPISRTLGAIALNQQDDTRTEENKRIKDSVPEASALDAIWATYLNIPENQRRNINSKYGISKTKDGYYRFNSPEMIFNFEQDLSPHGLFRLPGRKAVMMNGILGNYTTGLGRDTKGDYIFYSDSRLNPDGTPDIKTGWDINPYSNTVDNDTEETTEEYGQYGQDKKDLSYKIGKALFGNIEDISMGIGTPVPIYDKIYLDDYYGLSKEQQGGHYLPEITVYGNKHSIGGPLVEAAMNEYKKGGKIHIKPENRGKFTRLKERTGHSATWFKQHGTPAQRKMATFALNARKWKHGLGGNLFSPGGDTKTSDYRYVLDDDGEWNRVANDEMGRVFQGLTVTPAGGSGQPAPARYRISYDAGVTKDDAEPIRNLFSKIQEVADTPIMVQQTPGTAVGYNSFGQYMPKSQSTYGDQADLLLTELTAPTMLSDAKGIYQVFRHPTQTAKAIRSIFSEGTPAAEWASFDNALNSEWYQNLLKTYGKDNANNIVSFVTSAEGRDFFLGDDPQKAKKVYDRFANQRDIISKITGNVDEGKAAVSGSAAISHEGTLNRSGAALHDLDISAYMGNASKTVNPSLSRTEHLELGNSSQLKSAPIFDIIKNAYPKSFAKAKPKISGKLYNELTKLNRWWTNDLKLGEKFNPFPNAYREGVFNITPMYNISDAGANRVVMTRINGEPIDIFLSDNYLPAKGGFMSADNVMQWKRAFINKRMNQGFPPRKKDIRDLENFVPFSENNPVITTSGKTQYAPFSFTENTLINSEGLPVLSPVETWPGSGEFVPSFMNYKGELHPFIKLK